jgi:hypothetical protein
MALGLLSVSNQAQALSAGPSIIVPKAGGDWAVAIADAVKKCPENTAILCKIDATNLDGSVPSKGFNIYARSNLIIEFGAGDYYLKPESQLRIVAPRPLSHGYSYVGNMEVYGAGADRTRLHFKNENIHSFEVIGRLVSRQGDYKGTYFPIVKDGAPVHDTPILPAGTTKFTIRPEDAAYAKIAPRNFLIIGSSALMHENGEFDLMSSEWVSVKDYNPTTGLVTLNWPLRYSHGASGRPVWEKNSGILMDFKLHDLSIENSGGGWGTLYLSTLYRPEVYNMKVYGGCGEIGHMTTALYHIFSGNFHHNVFKVDNVNSRGEVALCRAIEVGGSQASVLSDNKIQCDDPNKPGASLLMVSFGSNNTQLVRNTINCKGIGKFAGLYVNSTDGVNALDNVINGGTFNMKNARNVVYNDNKIVLPPGKNSFNSADLIVRNGMENSRLYQWSPSKTFTVNARLDVVKKGSPCIQVRGIDNFIYCARETCKTGDREPSWSHTAAYNFDSTDTAAITRDGTCNWYTSVAPATSN